jgi:hypothetical protein
MALRPFAWNLLILPKTHGGIITATQQLDPDLWIPRVDQFLKEEPNIEGRMFVWYQTQQRWREDEWRPERL